MKIFSTIISIILFSAIINAQTPDISWNVSVPEYIGENTNISFGITVLFQEVQADSAIIMLSDNYNLIPDSAHFRSTEMDTILPIKNDINGTEIVLPNSIIDYFIDSPFQIVLEIKNPIDNEINFSCNFFNKGKLTYEVSSDAVNPDGNYLTPAVIRVNGNYINKNSLELSKNGSCGLNLNFDQNQTPRISFGINFKHPSNKFFYLFGSSSFDTLLSIKINKFNIPEFSSTENISLLNNVFISPDVWNRFEITFDGSDFLLKVNNIDVVKKQSSIFPNEIKMLQFNNYTDSTILLSDIKISSPLLYQEEEKDSILSEINFSNFTSIDEIDNHEFIANKVQLINASVPNISYPPKIDISISSAYSTIEWYNDKDPNIEKFILEKSTADEPFSPVFTVDNPEQGKRYSYQSYNMDDEKITYFRVKQISKNGTELYSSQVKIGHAKIEDFVLKQNFPNPFNPTTTFELNVIVPGYFDIGIYDLVGKEIKLLHSGTLSSGIHNFSFNGEDLPSGIYLIKVKSGNNSVVRKMILTK